MSPKHNPRPRPCVCNRVTGPIYTEDQCYLCWLVTHDETFAGHWSAPHVTEAAKNKQIVAERRKNRACEYRGDKTRKVPCKCVVPPDVYSCASPENPKGECTLVRGPGQAIEPGLPVCDGCPWRKAPEEPKPRPNPGVPLFSRSLEIEQCDLRPLSFQLIDDTKLHRSSHHRNGGLIRYRGKMFLVYRFNWGNCEVHVAEVDETLKPISDKKLQIIKLATKNNLGDEDPRPFIFNDRLWFISNGFTKSGGRLETIMHTAEVPLDGSRVKSNWMADYPRRRPWEKNWAPFVHNGTLYAVYQIEPTHSIVKLSGSDVSDVSEVPFLLNPSLGLQRGGAAPFLHNGEYYHFTHSVYQLQDRDKSIRQNYAACLYTFSNKPPFEPLRKLPFPLLVPSGAASVGGNHRVVFPCGAFFENGQWIVSGGWHDQRLFVARFDGDEIERHLVPA